MMNDAAVEAITDALYRKFCSLPWTGEEEVRDVIRWIVCDTVLICEGILIPEDFYR